LYNNRELLEERNFEEKEKGEEREAKLAQVRQQQEAILAEKRKIEEEKVRKKAVLVKKKEEEEKLAQIHRDMAFRTDVAITDDVIKPTNGSSRPVSHATTSTNKLGEKATINSGKKKPDSIKSNTNPTKIKL